MRFPDSRRQFRVICRTILIISTSSLKRTEHYSGQFTDHVKKRPVCFCEMLEATGHEK